MKEHPILFSGPMVKAILDGRKTQTRRVLKLDSPALWRFRSLKGGIASFSGCRGMKGVPCPYEVGQILWVRENFYIDQMPWDKNRLPKTRPVELTDDTIYYPADARGHGNLCCQLIPECCCAEIGKPKIRPSIHMPRWLSRITLEITGVKIERLNEISEEDAVDEGLFSNGFVACGVCYPHSKENCRRCGFKVLWENINGDGAWHLNPWVFCISFRKVEATK